MSKFFTKRILWVCVDLPFEILVIHFGVFHHEAWFGFRTSSLDEIQLLMILLFFVVWGIDTLSFFMFEFSTVIIEVLSLLVLFVGTIVFLFLSFYLVSKSHKAVLEQVYDPPQLADSGVYAWMRHPMYLGTLLFCLSFLFTSVSLAAIVFWIAFFIFYDRMATYEEKSVAEILGESYIAYQKRVSKWVPGIF